MLQQGKYNWFDFLEQNVLDSSDPLVEAFLKDFYSHVLSLPLSSRHKDLVTKSHAAFDAALPNADESRTAAILNGDIVTDSESDNADEYVGLVSVASKGVKKIVAKKRKSLSRRVRRQKVKPWLQRTSFPAG